MKGDFTRDSHDRGRHYSRVLMQQGRVQVDADWNEQGAITDARLRDLALDVIGPHGGPGARSGFDLVTDASVLADLRDDLGRPLASERLDELKAKLGRGDFLIGQGPYYVDGVRAVCDTWMTYTEQLGYPFDDESTLDALTGVDGVQVYLDVWERHVSAAERPGLADVALGGVDTTSRAEVVWQVRIRRGDGPLACEDYRDLLRERVPMLRAAARQPEEDAGACVIDPESRYRGAENQLYRVEIQRGGRARTAAEVDGGATFAWSRENGSVLFPVLRAVTEGDRTTVELASLGRDRRSGLEVGDLVQLVDDASAHRSTATPVLRVEDVDRDDLLVVLSGDSDGTGSRQDLHPVLRRWDHRADDPATSDLGSLLVREGAGDDGWIELEDGVVVQFPGAADGGPADYRSGDHWLVPARTATGDVLWPQEEVDGEQVARPRLPDGVEHHVAPLAIGLLDDGEWTWASSCRNRFAVLPSAI